jgi:hypothetical protein
MCDMMEFPSHVDRRCGVVHRQVRLIPSTHCIGGRQSDKFSGDIVYTACWACSEGLEHDTYSGLQTFVDSSQDCI